MGNILTNKKTTLSKIEWFLCCQEVKMSEVCRIDERCTSLFDFFKRKHAKLHLKFKNW
jgi:hypothetical protein